MHSLAAACCAQRTQPELLCRYEDIIFETAAYVPRSHSMKEQAELADKGIHRLKVYVATNDQSLNLQTDESYALTVSAPTSTLEVGTATQESAYYF